MLLAGCSAPSFRVMSMNQANGYVLIDGSAPYRTPPARAAQAQLILEQGPDAVGFQEVDGGCARSGSINTAGAVVPLGGTFLYAEATVTEGCSIGVALWLRAGVKLIDTWNVPLDYPDDVWPRVALYARVRDEGGRELLLATAHLSTYMTTRETQLPEAVAGSPDVFFGDFNALGPEVEVYVPPAYKELTSPGCIDQVWSTHPGRGWLPPTHALASDHPFVACGDIL